MTDLPAPVARAVGAALGCAVDDARPLGGGDINDAFAVTLADGRTVFVKTNASAPPTMFPAEARGLAWLRDGGALPIPEVLAVSGAGDDEPAFLALELLTPGPRRVDFDEVLGRGLGALHAAEPTGFGLDHDNFIGRLPQVNAPLEDWPSFYRDRRLLPQLALAQRRGIIGPGLRRSFDRLFEVLEDRVGPPEPPARLHGDLWGGNLHVTCEGAPALIDPAVYGGHREMDLAMMRLFGGFGAHVYEAYDEAWPLAPGADERVPLYQLYPLLVHVNLFGGGYLPSLERALSAAL